FAALFPTSNQNTPPGFPGVAYGCGDTFCAQAALPAPRQVGGRQFADLGPHPADFVLKRSRAFIRCSIPESQRSAKRYDELLPQTEVSQIHNFAD
ncbi:MAG: hypothetical protein KDE45_17625, partial [Caldilineaceae bacterium]|nr:hypothetical protein [Caldilineaceae bacterium]